MLVGFLDPSLWENAAVGREGHAEQIGLLAMFKRYVQVEDVQIVSDVVFPFFKDRKRVLFGRLNQDITTFGGRLCAQIGDKSEFYIASAGYV